MPITDKAILKAIDAHVGRQFRTAYEFRGVKLTRLSRDIQVSYQQMQKNQKGENRFHASRMYQVASYLKLPPSFFFDGLPLIKTEPLPTLEKEHFKVLRLYESIPEKNRKEVLNFLKLMAGDNE